MLDLDSIQLMDERLNNRLAARLSRVVNISLNDTAEQVMQGISLTEAVIGHENLLIQSFRNHAKLAILARKKRHDYLDRRLNKNLDSIDIEEIIENYMLRHAVDRVSNIADNTKKTISKKILEGIMAGESNAVIAKALREIKGINKRRAKIIARTETHRALNTANQEISNRYQALTGEQHYKVWISSQDERTRTGIFDHAKPHKQIVKSNESFRVSGENLRHPGDPQGSAGNVINCRCTVITGSKFVMNNLGYKI